MTNATLEMRDFSRREQQIVAALLEAKAVKDIAVDLDLSVNTVKDYLKSIYRKAQVHSARELMLKMSRPEPAPDAALAQFLQTAQNLEVAAMPRQALAQLGAAVMRCTRARRVSFWRMVRGPHDAFLASDEGMGTLRIGAFLQGVLDRGWGRLEAGETRGLEGHQLTALGMGPEVIGVRCAPTARVQLMLIGDPVEGRFGALDLATVRLLARLAQPPGGIAHQTLTASA